VTHLGTAPLCLFVRDGMAARSIDEFVNLARANPGRLSVGTAGPGTASHMNFELIAKSTGLEALLVPFRTSSQAMA
jgi:tripartite-type tricarboxylate transporter receptor subunit TctC